MKRALARAQLETWGLPKKPLAGNTESRFIIFYYYDGVDDGKYKYIQDASLGLNDSYAEWTFDKKVILGSVDFGNTSKVQNAYNHAEVIAFYRPPYIGLEDEDYEQVMTKTLACFDLGSVPTPLI